MMIDYVLILLAFTCIHALGFCAGRRCEQERFQAERAKAQELFELRCQQHRDYVRRSQPNGVSWDHHSPE